MIRPAELVGNVDFLGFSCFVLINPGSIESLRNEMFDQEKDEHKNDNC